MRSVVGLPLAGVLVGTGAGALARPAPAQTLDSLVVRLASATAVSGYEDELAESLLAMLPGSRADAAGNVVWRSGGGEPVRVALCAIDEPGYAVGGITPEGFLTLRRVGAAAVGPLHDQLLEGQRVTVFGGKGPVPGVVGVRSIHLTRGAPPGADPPFALADAYLDVGASSPNDVHGLGIELLAPVARAKRVHRYGADLVASPAAAARSSCAALLFAVLQRPSAREHGDVAAVFARRGSFDRAGERSALRDLRALQEGRRVVHLGQPGSAEGLGAGTVAAPSTALRDAPAPGDTAGSEGEEAAGDSVTWSLPTRHAGTPVETVSLRDVEALADSLASFLWGRPALRPATTGGGGKRGQPANAEGKPGAGSPSSDSEAAAGDGRFSEAATANEPFAEAGAVLAELVAAYGVSGREAPVREAVKRLLPDWATPETDDAGNVHVRVGEGQPLVVFVAHLDEVGFAVTGVRPDGRLDLDPQGGFFLSLFEAQPALVHTERGPVPAVIAPRETPAEGAVPSRTPEVLLADPGTGSAAGTEALGIRPGDTVTMPKELVPLAGSRVTARSLDDRVGSSAQILALRHLDRGRLRHQVLFLWSTREEIGLEGARAAAAALAPERPVRVHAVDTFVSSDAPLERKGFAHAPLGKGPVIRAVDGSAVAPPALVDSLLRLAERRGIPLQVGATGGGNDGSVFVPYGTPDVAIGWPLRYSHSPAEVADLGDVVALADLVRAIAEEW